MIIKSQILLDQLMELHKNGYPEGYDIGFQKFPLTFVKGGCTDITGYPFYGKSIVLKEIIVSLTIKHNWKHLIYMPDEGNSVDILSNLLEKYLGKSFNKDDYNYMTEKDISQNYLSVLQNFCFVDETRNFSPQELWELGKKEKCDSVVIDSWNYLNHSDDPIKPNYLRSVLSFRNKFMQANKMHAFTIIHPKNPDPRSVIEGKVNKPTVYDIMGGSEWNNNGRNILVIHKESKDYNQPYQVYCDKVKPKQYGSIDNCNLFLQWEKQKMYQIKNGEKKYGY
jgi:hypothetical protein